MRDEARGIQEHDWQSLGRLCEDCDFGSKVNGKPYVGFYAKTLIWFSCMILATLLRAGC